jgi:hypothetical protein
MSISSNQLDEIKGFLSAGSFHLGGNIVYLFNLSPYLDEVAITLARIWRARHYDLREATKLEAVVVSCFPDRTYAKVGVKGNILKIDLRHPDCYRKGALSALADGFNSLASTQETSVLEDTLAFFKEIGGTYYDTSDSLEPIRYYTNSVELARRKRNQHLRLQLYKGLESFQRTEEKLKDAQADHEVSTRNLAQKLELMK